MLSLNTSRKYNYPTEDNYEAAKRQSLKRYGRKSAITKDYDQTSLIFEGLNEPRVIGTSEEWNGGSDPTRGS